ncbi:MAG: N-acetyltransferase [Sphingobacteriales bacterium]|nr:MAG: N-acetyltransferase [Sphingobacteriales bacterium]
MENYFAHSSAFIDNGCQIGEGTKIWHFCHIMPAAEIGKNCVLGQNVFVAGKVKIGNNVKIQNNVSLYEGVICEDDVFLGPSMVFTNVTNPRSFIERKDEYKPTVIRRGATVGANVTIVCGNEIGEYALVGAGSVITKPVFAYELVAGNPAKRKGWISQRGMKLFFDDAGYAFCKESGEQYFLQDNKVLKVENAR